MEFKYTVKDSDKSIKQILKNEFNMSERYILKLKKNKCIQINGQSVHINYPIFDGDILYIFEDLAEDSSNIVPNQDISLKILFEDEYLLIVDKQPGIPVHPSILHYENSLSNCVKYYFNQIGLNKKIRPVNRLDKDTSGIVLFAKNDYIQECLVKQMKSNTFKKYYIAILEGIVENEYGTITAPIARKDGSIIAREISLVGETAISHYKVIKRFSYKTENTLFSLTEVEFSIETGRTHQIRLHSKHIGHPIIGDTLYGNPSELISRQALHSYKVEFIHPVTKKMVSIEAEIPNDMSQILI